MTSIALQFGIQNTLAKRGQHNMDRPTDEQNVVTYKH